MPFRLGWPELVVVLLIVLVLFGGRLSKVAGDLAKGINIFRKNLQEDFDDPDDEDEEKIKKEP